METLHKLSTLSVHFQLTIYNYYPFGLEINTTTASPKNEYLYNKKELQEETGLYDYGWRQYDPVIGRWTTIDELAEKYAALSPYIYVADNPIKNTDPDGKRIIFAPGTTAAYKKEFAQAVKYLNAHGAGRMLAKLQARKEVVMIGMGGKDNANGTFSIKKSEIFWDPTEGVKTDKGVKLSPASVLNHETDHALDAVSNPTQHAENSKPGSDPQYDTKEEKRVITGSEQTTAKKLGEIKDGEVTRTDHDGTSYQTTGPTTTQAAPIKPVALQEVIVRPQKN